MAFRFPPPSDPRAHYEEAIAIARKNSLQTKHVQQLAQHQQPQQPHHEQDGGNNNFNDNINSNKINNSSSSNNSPNTNSAVLYSKKALLETPNSTSLNHQRRNIIFPDPIAFRYLEEDPQVTVVERKTVLCGYELYLVEQWACSRLSPTLVIATFTGDDKHSIVAGVLSVPANKEAWSPKLRVYFKALEQNHARSKDTYLGELMVTNLSSFPSALTVIPVPDGDIKTYRQYFIVNEDMKRLGCSGRAGMTLTEPSNATQSKFYQLYKASDRIPFSDAVIELVKLCQVALLIFGKLEHEYIDGLLCDKTETAINNWWAEVGLEYHNVEPTDGILGPTTVAALLGTLMGARNRLAWCSTPVSKDVFDMEATKRGIGVFQKAHKLERTRRLDRQTLLKLHTVTAKAAAGETWGVQKAVKSTVAEIGGKRGELVIGMVGGRDKGCIGDIENTDIDKFISLSTGERAKWLWYGKPRRTGASAELQGRGSPEIGDHSVHKDMVTPGKQNGKKPTALPLDEAGEMRVKEQSPSLANALPANLADGAALESSLSAEKRRTVFKSVADKMSDARSGLGRIKDAVGGGLRGHGGRPSRDEPFGQISPHTHLHGVPTLSETMPSPMVSRAFTWKQKPEEYLAAMRRNEPDLFPIYQMDEYKRYQSSTLTPGTASATDTSRKSPALNAKQTSLSLSGAEIQKDLIYGPSSVAGSVVDEKDLRGPILDQEQGPHHALAYLSRRHSIPSVLSPQSHVLNEARWPRRMSFSDAEDAVLVREGFQWSFDPGNPDNPLENVAYRDLYRNIISLRENVEPWVLSKLSAVEALDVKFGKSQEQLQGLYCQLSETYHRAKEESEEIVVEQRAQATEAIKDVEVLAARLEYEINSLVSKVEEVEEGIGQFEREVSKVERRAKELKEQLETENWLHWFVRTLTGVGTGPSITRSNSEELLST